MHVANLPLDFTSAELATVFDGVPGVLEVEMYGANTDSPFGYVSLASLATAQHAYALKHNTLPRTGAIKTIELKIYSADGTPLDPHRQVEPVVNNLHGGGGPGGAAPHVFNNYRGPMQGAMPLRYPRPRVPFHFTAAELARRVYLGCLRWGITDAEVASLFHERAGVVAKVLRVMNAHDGSHAFGCGNLLFFRCPLDAVYSRYRRALSLNSFVQLPDAITADHAIKVLHGTVSGEQLPGFLSPRADPCSSNPVYPLRLFRRSPASGRTRQRAEPPLALVAHFGWLAAPLGLPRWSVEVFSPRRTLTRRDLTHSFPATSVSDFLISTIGSFAGLIVRHSPAYSGDSYAAELHVRVELRYETELRWAFNELNGLMIDRQPVRAVIDQARVRREVENELAFQQLAQGIATGQQDHQAAQRLPTATPMSSVHGGSTGGGYDPRDPAGTNGGTTPTQKRPQPPPPPPAPPEAAVPALDDDALNPFSPKWLSNR